MSSFQWEDIDPGAGNVVTGIISGINPTTLRASVSGIGSDIPIHYHCDEALSDDGRPLAVSYPDILDEKGATAFKAGDTVSVIYRRRNNIEPMIIGFPDYPHPCIFSSSMSSFSSSSLSESRSLSCMSSSSGGWWRNWYPYYSVLYEGEIFSHHYVGSPGEMVVYWDEGESYKVCGTIVDNKIVMLEEYIPGGNIHSYTVGFRWVGVSNDVYSVTCDIENGFLIPASDAIWEAAGYPQVSAYGALVFRDEQGIWRYKGSEPSIITSPYLTELGMAPGIYNFSGETAINLYPSQSQYPPFRIQDLRFQIDMDPDTFYGGIATTIGMTFDNVQIHHGSSSSFSSSSESRSISSSLGGYI